MTTCISTAVLYPLRLSNAIILLLLKRVAFLSLYIWLRAQQVIIWRRLLVLLVPVRTLTIGLLLHDDAVCLAENCMIINGSLQSMHGPFIIYFIFLSEYYPFLSPSLSAKVNPAILFANNYYSHLVIVTLDLVLHIESMSIWDWMRNKQCFVLLKSKSGMTR